jgi:hypothetical protein
VLALQLFSITKRDLVLVVNVTTTVVDKESTTIALRILVSSASHTSDATGRARHVLINRDFASRFQVAVT